MGMSRGREERDIVGGREGTLSWQTKEVHQLKEQSELTAPVMPVRCVHTSTQAVDDLPL